MMMIKRWESGGGDGGGDGVAFGKVRFDTESTIESYTTLPGTLLACSGYE